MELHPYLFCLPFYLLYFFLPPFKNNGLLFWVPDVLCWHSEVVLWNLLSWETQEMQIRSLGWEDPLEEEMATHSRILAWEIPWTEEHGGL